MSDEDRGKNLIADAEKKVKSSQGLFGSFFGGTAKLEEATELYARAGNAFKMAKKWSAGERYWAMPAGNAFCEAAKIQLNQLQSKHDAASNFVEAANCWRKTDFDEAIKCLQRAIEIFTDMGRFTIAAKHHVTIAEIYESNLMDIDKAIENYEQAADFYKGEESNSSANKCLLKIALYSAQQENYQKAIAIYEEVAATSLESSLLKYSAKEYFFRSSLCHMCIDMLESQRVIEKYSQMYPAFEDSRECKLLKSLVEASEKQDVEAFTEAVREFDAISRLDQWYTTILLRVKKNLTEEPDLT